MPRIVLGTKHAAEIDEKQDSPQVCLLGLLPPNRLGP